MRVSAEAIHNGISKSRFIEVVIPFCDRELRSHDNGFPLITVLQDLQQRKPRVIIERL